MSALSPLRTFAIATLLFTASATLAQAGPLSNRASVQQEGDGNGGAITQNGAANNALIGQYGYDNTATIRQDGYGNAACIIQSGVGHDSAIAQAGDYNNVGIVQTPLRTRLISADQCARINARRAAQAIAQQNAARRSGVRRWQLGSGRRTRLRISTAALPLLSGSGVHAHGPKMKSVWVMTLSPSPFTPVNVSSPPVGPGPGVQIPIAHPRKGARTRRRPCFSCSR